jgi:ribosomal protein S13
MKKILLIVLIMVSLLVVSCAQELTAEEELQLNEELQELDDEQLEQLENELNSNSVVGEAFYGNYNINVKRLNKNLVKKKLRVEKLARSTRANVLEIKNAGVTRLDSSNIELYVSLYKPGRSRKETVELFWVDGRRRYELDSFEGNFVGTRGGMQSPVTLSLNQLRDRVLWRGYLEFVIPSCKEEDVCKKRISLARGDLRIDRDVFEDRGRERLSNVDIINKGLQNSPRCRVSMSIDDEFVSDAQVPVLEPDEKTTVTLRALPGSGKRYEIKLHCNDLSGNGNSVKARTP